MTSYVFSPQANERQDEIFLYTYEQFGIKQAEKYMRGLHGFLSDLGDKREVWRSVPQSLSVPADLDINVHFAKFQKHYIFFRVFDDGVLGILDILHEAMDMPVRLAEDLQKINKGD